MKKEQTSKLHKLTAQELKDFRVPLQVFMEFNKYLMKARGPFKVLILESVGVNTKDRDPKVDWLSFLKLNQVMRHKCYHKDEYVDFVANLFDPNDTGFVKGKDFETLINQLFESEINEEDDQTEPNKKVATFSEHLLEYCAKIGVYKVDGFFNL